MPSVFIAEALSIPSFAARRCYAKVRFGSFAFVTSSRLRRPCLSGFGLCLPRVRRGGGVGAVSSCAALS